MTTGSNRTRPFEAPSYATLRATEAEAAQGRADAAAPSPASLGDIDREVDKLRQLREALWDAFAAGPDAGLPNGLIDLTLAYTGALRLQLSLKAVSWRQTKRQTPPTTSGAVPLKR